jgi:uncharacterized membrane protein
MSVGDKDNPFAPPKAAVLEAASSDAEYIPDGRKVEAGRGMAWFSEGWTLFKASPGIWVVMFIVFFVLSLVLAIIPLGSLLSSLFYPAVVAGIMLGCQELEQGGELRLNHLFEGFKKNLGSLVLVGVLYLVGVMLIGLIAGVGAAMMIPMMAGSFDPENWSSVMSMLPFFALIFLVALALMMPLIMALWFAPAIVVFHDEQPMAAMRSSFMGCLKTFVPFLVYGIVGFFIGLVALIPLGLGLLVVGPLIWATMYTGYRDIFVRRA